jgi:hypothetical protein
MGPTQRAVLRVLYGAKVHLGIQNLSSKQIAAIITDAYGHHCGWESVRGAISGMGRQHNRYWLRESRVYGLPKHIGWMTVHPFNRRFEITDRGEMALVQPARLREQRQRYA